MTAIGAADAGAAFAIPTVVHFGVVLFLSAIADVPWQGIGILSVVWALLGLVGIGYLSMVVRHMRVHLIRISRNRRLIDLPMKRMPGWFRHNRKALAPFLKGIAA